MTGDPVQGRSGRNGFAALGVQRWGERRGDEGWLAAQLAHPGSQCYPVWGNRSLVEEDSSRALGLGREELGEALGQAESLVFLGRWDGVARFAVAFDAQSPPAPIAGRGRFVDLRAAAPLLDEGDAALLAYARAMATWHRGARFCGACGSATESRQGGFVRRCTGEACGREQFPRIDPAIIVLVEDDGRCLLGRQGWWEAGRHSVIAGYLEPGETFEAAVAREVREETSVAVTEVHYRSSQPWPFPSSLMVGFRAQAVSRDIELLDGELESARWFSRQQLVSELKSGQLTLPYQVSIAYRLIEEWFDDAPGWRLAEWAGGG